LISTADVTVGVDLNVPSGDIVVGATTLIDGRNVSNDASVWQGHLDTLTGNPHEVEGTEVKSTAEGAGLVLTSTAGGVSEWLAGGTGNVTAGADITDNTIVRGNGGTKGVQESGIAISDTDNITGVADITVETLTATVGAESTEYGEYGIAPYASRITQFTIGGVTQTGTIIDVSLLGMASSDAAEVGGSTYVIGGIASAGTKGGDLNLWGGNSTTTGTADGGDVNISGGASFGGSLGKVYVEGSSFELATPLVTNSTIDGIDVNTDVTANNDHRADVTTNPHGVTLASTPGQIGSGTLSSLNSVVADATLHGTHANGDVTGGTILTIGDGKVTLAKMADGTAGALIVYDTSGSPVDLGVGTANQVLTSNVGFTPSWEDVPAATTSAAGIVELATSGEDADDKVVQGSDARLDAFTATQDGLVPSPTTATGLYLEDDGSWSAPATSSAPTLTKSITVEDPVTGDDITMFFTPVAITITNIRSNIIAGTDFYFDLEWSAFATRGSTTAINGSAIIADTNGTTTTPSSDPTIPAASWVSLACTTGGTGTPTELHVTLTYTED